MQFNIKYYPWYSASVSAMAWLPIFYLYFSEHLSLGEVVLLESIYYFSVVLLEIPSGYFSDLMGRRTTLIISTVLFAISYILFGMGVGFASFVIAQLVLAGGMAFRSGSDTALLYESLVAQNRDSEYGDQEARSQKISMIAGGLAVIIGGFLGSYDLALGYWASFIFLVPAMVIVWMYKEDRVSPTHTSFIPQLKNTVKYLSHPILRWLFLYSLVIFVLVHIPYEFYQGYLSLLEGGGDFIIIDAAVTSGLLFGITRFIGAIAASQSMKWGRIFGLKWLLMGAGFLQLLILACMGWILHSAILLIILLRNFSMALTSAPIKAAIAPLIKTDHRATYLSMQSLVSRLGFGIVLFLISVSIEQGSHNSWHYISTIFLSGFGGGLLLLTVLFLTNKSA